jgi:hypothetical protein
VKLCLDGLALLRVAEVVNTRRDATAPASVATGARSRRRPGARPIASGDGCSRLLADSYLHCQAHACQPCAFVYWCLRIAVAWGACRTAPLLSSCTYRPKNRRLDGGTRDARGQQRRPLEGSTRRSLHWQQLLCQFIQAACSGSAFGRPRSRPAHLHLRWRAHQETLQMQSSGRWAVCRPGQEPVEIKPAMSFASRSPAREACMSLAWSTCPARAITASRGILCMTACARRSAIRIDFSQALSLPAGAERPLSGRSRLREHGQRRASNWSARPYLAG